MPLTTYEQARPWAKAIKEQVLERQMPPWGAVSGFGEFRGDPSLSQEEIAILADWVEGGAPEGDPAYLPTARPSLVPATAPLGRHRRMSGRAALTGAMRLVAIRPKADGMVASARLIATRPDGSMEPLLWLRGYQGRTPHAFVLAEPLTLPAGTVLQSTGDDVTYELIYR